MMRDQVSGERLPHVEAANPTPPTISSATVLICAVACGAIVANLYYAQPLVAPIARDLHLGPEAAGLVVTLTQLGYATGLLTIVPLADRIENRTLICATVGAAAAALVLLGFATTAAPFLIASYLVGIFCSGAQVVLPFAAGMAPEAERGRTVGNVMAGLLAGIMLSRPIASIVTSIAGWRAIFLGSAIAMAALSIWLRRKLPKRQPGSRLGYGAMLRSMGALLLRERMLQRRALYHGFVLAIFNIFWTAAPLALQSRFGFGQLGIAAFALAGAAGALVAPLAGRLGDRGYIRLGTAGAMAAVTLSCVGANSAVAIGSIALLVAFALALDGATQVNQVLGFRVVFSLPGEDKGRINAVYMTILFSLGALGSELATWAFHSGGWSLAMLSGAGLGALVLAGFGTERIDPQARSYYASRSSKGI